MVKVKRKKVVKPSPVWDLYTHGITQGVLANWLACRQKCQYGMRELLSPEVSGSAVQFGTLCHNILEKIMLNNMDFERLEVYATEAETAYREEVKVVTKESEEELQMNLMTLEAMLPTYFKFWNWKDMKWVDLEKEFCIPFELPDGRVIPGRGKIDGLFQASDGLWIWETKTKGRIDPNLMDTLPFELQVGFYSIAAEHIYKKPVKGVLYNLIKRPELRIKKGEYLWEFKERIRQDVISRPDFYFIQWRMDRDKEESDRFRLEFTEILREFAEWYDGKTQTYRRSGECLKPWGPCGYLPVCSRGDFSNLKKRVKIFPELEEE